MRKQISQLRFSSLSLLSSMLISGLFLMNAAVAEEPDIIVAFGDSTTAVRGPLKIYASLLQRELPKQGMRVKIINAGVGGHNTVNARARFERDVLAHKPTVVIIQFGINDAAVDVWKDPPHTEPRVSLATYAQNLQYFVQTLKQLGIRPILMTPNPIRWTPKLKSMYGKPPYEAQTADGFNVLLKDYVASVRQLAKTQQVTLVDVYRQYEEFDRADNQSMDDLLLDGMHPNDKGHRLVADQLLKELHKTVP